jgi:hypothetical protein
MKVFVAYVSKLLRRLGKRCLGLPLARLALKQLSPAKC